MSNRITLAPLGAPEKKRKCKKLGGERLKGFKRRERER
jgi:hypothetical protein